MKAQLEDIDAHFAVVNGYKTHYLEAGTGDPVVLLHGSGPGVTAAANWAGTIPVLARRHRVIAIELLGFGSSDRAKGLKYNIAAWVDHLVGTLDALGLDRVKLVGNSLGGAVSLFAALEHAGRLDRMVLMGSPGVGMSLTDGLKAVRSYEPTLAKMTELLRTYFVYDPERATDELIRERYAASSLPGEQENYRAIHAGQVARENRPFTEDLVRQIQTPTLLIHGREDRVLPVDISWNMARLLPNADLNVLHRCGHWVQIERAETFNTLVSSFFAGNI